MTNFKVGDKVTIHHRNTGNTTGLARGWNLPNGNAGEVGFITLQDSTPLRNKVMTPDGAGYLGWFSDDELRPYGYEKAEGATTASEVKFILQYELDEDPFETFVTMKEVEARIKELAKRADLKRESIKVYEVAKTYDVKLETRVIFGGTKVKLEEKARPAAKKRGRPAGSKNLKSNARSKAMKAAWARRKAALAA